jgi:protein phosphatase
MLVVTSKYVYACNVGDSEIYHKNQYGIERLSKPQTFAQELVDVGAISEYQASRSYRRNQLSQYLGMEKLHRLKPNETYTTMRSGDMLLICSDGISDVLPDHSIYASLSSTRPVLDIADAIIEKALRKGSGDNLTVVIARVLDDGRAAMLKKRFALAAGMAAGAAAFFALLMWLL